MKNKIKIIINFLNLRKKTIFEFEPVIKDLKILFPAKTFTPDWYKKMPLWKNNEMHTTEKGFNHSLKHCIPFLDSLITGYVLSTPYDLYVKNDNGTPFLTWKGEIEKHNIFMPSCRPEVADLNLVPAGHFPTEFVWRFNCSIKIPKEYSVLVTHPLNRHDLPFTSASGIVDGGFAIQSDGNFPFYLKKDFEGIIPKGTPFVQLIPFYRESWLLKQKNGLIEESKKNSFASSLVIFGWYKKTFWRKKTYE